MGGEIGGVDPGEDEEAGVIDDEVETLSCKRFTNVWGTA
jgi:hypothetical protein